MLDGVLKFKGLPPGENIHLHHLYGNAAAVAEASYLETADHCRVLADDERVCPCV